MNKKVIDKLTDADYKRIAELRDEFLKIGIATGAGNRNACEIAIRKCYTQSGHKEPKRILWFRSVREGAIAKAILLEKNDASYEEIMKRIENGNYKIDSSILQNAIYGQHDVAWLALYKFFSEKIDGLEKIHAIIEVAKNACWWWAFEDVAIVTERPVKISLNNNNQLHCADGPAILFGDGFAVYAWNGLRIPKHFIEDRHKITYEMINKERNNEYKRILVDLYGRDRYLKDINAKKISEDRYGILWQGRDNNQEQFTIVEVQNRTPEFFDGKFQFRKFFLRVPPGMKTAHEAVAWTFFKTPETYNPIKET